MPVQTPQTNGSRYRGDDNGKCLCVSFPGHELDLIEDLDSSLTTNFVIHVRNTFANLFVENE